MDTRASNVITHICTTARFGLKMRIEKVRGNREGTAVSSHRQLCFSWEEKMMFSGGEMVFHRLEIRSKATNVTLEEVSRHPSSSAEGQSDLGTFVVPSPDENSEAGFLVAILKILI